MRTAVTRVIWQKTDMIKKDKGFSISFDDTRDILMTRVWGMWDEAFAEKYGYGLKEKVEEVYANEQIWGILADLRELLPRSEEVQQIIMRKQFALTRILDIEKIAYLDSQTTTQLQMNTFFQESDRQVFSCFESEDEAIQWLLKES
jgi:hypothetical protein